jgi:hypothetical protein
MKKMKKNLQVILKIQMHFQSNYLILWFKFFYRCVDLGEIFMNEIYLFSFGKKYEKDN